MKLMQINKEIVLINSHMMDNNTFIILKNDKAIIVDPSFAGDAIIDYFKNNQSIKPIAVILTHAHFDHCLDTAKILKYFNIPVYLHELDKSTYEKYNCIDWVGLELEKFDNNIKYFNSNNLKIGDFDLEILLTAGHTSGSVTIIYKNYAFVGDTLFYDGYGRIDLANSNETDMIKSIKTLFKVVKDDMYVFTGHGKCATFKEVKEVNFMANEINGIRGI